MLDLISPPRSRVSAADLHREVAEYFALGVRVKPGDTVLDVGANIGAFAMHAAAICKGDLHILAFEPSPETFDALRTNFAQNELLRKTRHRLFHLGLCAAVNAGQTISFYDFARFPTNSTFHLEAKRREFEIFFEDRGRRFAARCRTAVPGPLGRRLGALVEAATAWVPRGPLGWWITRRVMGLREHTVPVDTLSNVLAASLASVRRIDLVKIDVEGPELEILRGFDAAAWAIVQQVVIETHDRDGRLAEIAAIVREQGLIDVRMVRQASVDNGLESVILYACRPEGASTAWPVPQPGAMAQPLVA